MRISITALKDRNMRKKLYRYWVSDIIFGGANFLTHYTLRYVPLWMNSFIGSKIGRLAGKYRFTQENQRAKYNLKLFRPNASDEEVDALLEVMWGNVGKALCEYSVLDKLWNKGRVEMKNSHIVEACVKQNQPIIFTGAHLGNWEAQAAYCVDEGIPLMAMFKPPRNRMDILTVPTDKHAIKRMCDHLASKHALWLPIDDHKNGQVHTPRFGRPQALRGTNAAYIVRLAKRYNAAIIPVRTKRLDTFSPSLSATFHDAMYVNEDQDVDDVLARLDGMIEEWVLENPEQWYMLHELRLE